MGRYLKVLGEEPGAEVVGLDLSLAVNRARAENLQNPRVHVIQGNIMQLPLAVPTASTMCTASASYITHLPPKKRSTRL